MWVLLLYLLLFAVAFFSFFVGKKYFIRSSKILTQKLDLFSSVVFCVCVFLSSCCLYIIQDKIPLYTLYILFCSLFVLYYFLQKKISKYQKYFLFYFLSFIGVLGVSFLISDFEFKNLFVYLVYAVIWLFCWRLFCCFSNKPIISYVTSVSWGIAFFLSALIIASFPSDIAFFVGGVAVTLFAILRARLGFGLLNFGPYLSEISGFIWAGVWLFCALRSSLSILFLAYGYYLIELLFLLFSKAKKNSSETLFEKAFKVVDKKRKSISLIFSHIFLLSTLAILLSVINTTSENSYLLSLFLFIVIGVNLYNNLTHIDQPVGTWKDFISCIRSGIKEMPKGIKSVLDTPKERLKKKKTTKAKTKVRKK